MKKTNAETWLRVIVDCPYCQNIQQDILEDVKEDMGFELRAENINVEIDCENCKKTFLVENIEY